MTASSDGAAAWERWAGWYEDGARPLGEWFCRAVDARPGLAVIDVGCGAGFPALAVAARVRPGGRVVATDVSPDMTAVVARRARALALDGVSVRPADAAELPFADGSFDAATCSTALMLCRDPVRAAAEMRRVLKPGGRLAVAVWDERSRSPYFDLALDALAAVIPPPRGPDAPGPFRLARPGALEDVLRAAGFDEVEAERCPIAFECASPEEYVESFTSLAIGLKERLAALPPEESVRLREALAARARAYLVEGGRVRLAATPLCAAGRRGHRP
jgi:SAM-dependent methyltransferase